MAKTAKEGMIKKAEEAMDKHEKTAAAMVEFAQKGKQDSLATMLKKLNRVAGGGGVVKPKRTLFLIDLTSSMSSMLLAVKQTVGKFFERCNDILEKNHIETGFELQIGFYRNYNSTIEDIFFTSGWERKTDPLASFLSLANVGGGWQEEAVEVGLLYANQVAATSGLDQIILIGDAGANSDRDVQSKRNSGLTKTHPHSKGGIFPKGIPITNAESQATALANSGDGVKIHSFYIQNRAKDSFARLSNTTGGQCSFLDINSLDGAEKLTNLVCKSILEDIDDSLVAEYEKAYMPKMMFGR